MQEALLAAATQWPEHGIPDRPDGWLITVASRRLIDQIRSESASRRREQEDIARAPADQFVAPAADDSPAGRGDDTLTLLVLCCHPSLTPSTQVALTLRAVGGLRIAEIARAFLVPEPSMRQRLSRAKRTIKDAGGRFLAAGTGADAGFRPVLHVLYLMFNEGYTATSGRGPAARRADCGGAADHSHRRWPAARRRRGGRLTH